MTDKIKSEFKRFPKGMEGALILFCGICAGLGSLNFAAVSGQNFYTFVGIVSMAVSVFACIRIFKGIWNDNDQNQPVTGGGSSAEKPEKPEKDHQNMEK